jgi:hypothetical protein
LDIFEVKNVKKSFKFLLCIFLLTAAYSPAFCQVQNPDYEPNHSFSRSWRLPLNNPIVVSANEASFMEDDDVVFGIVFNEHPRAYPQWVMASWHVVNDTIDESAVLFTHCEACSGSAAFVPVVEAYDGGPLSFQLHGIGHGTFTISDDQTRTVWSPFTGRSFKGVLHPARMNRIPLIVTTWGDWRKRFPDTEVLLASRDIIKSREHGHGKIFTIGYLSPRLGRGLSEFANLADKRLEPNELVFGITNSDGSESIAFQLQSLEENEGLLRHTFAGEEYLLAKVSDFAVVALRLRKQEEARVYRQISLRPFRVGDDQGNVWNEFGHSNEEDGQDLQIANGYLTEWYEWVSHWPETDIAFR